MAFNDSEGLIAGVDEAGRGPLAGPVFAAAVILNPRRRIEGLKDSKQLTALQRQRLAAQIRENALNFCIAEASVAEIDRLNILRASLLAMQRAIQGLSLIPERALIDGNFLPDLAVPAQAIIRGDSLIEAISAASILAKVARDALMVEYHQQYPEFSFHQHKGYPTARHLEELNRHGCLDIHRRSFKPVKLMLAGEQDVQQPVDKNF